MAEQNPIELFIERAKILGLEDDPSSVDQIRMKDDDYTVSSFTKSGTTWVQQIVHQLRTGGDDNFEEISMPIPYLMPESHFGDQIGQSIRDQFYPRVWKTHLYYDELVPKGGKHIYVMRNPEDTLWSNLHFLPEIVQVEGLSVEDFYYRFYRDRKDGINYWRHLASWWPHHSEKDNILVIHFEDLKENKIICIKRIAEFLKIKLTPGLLDLVDKRSTFEYMSNNQDLFDGRFEVYKAREVLGLKTAAHIPAAVRKESMVKNPLPPKVREGGGKIGQGNTHIPQEIQEDMEKTWMERVFPKTGCRNYQEMRRITSVIPQ